MQQQQQSILGESAPRISTGGTIRPGIQVPTAATKQNPQAMEIYMAGVESQISFMAIKGQIADKCGLKNALRPMNTSFMIARRADFHPPSTADRLNEVYGSVKDDIAPGKFRLYGFPVIFPFDDIDQNLPHSLQEYSRSGIRHWSQYDHDGKRWCYQHGELPKDASGKVIRKVFGGRIPVLRPDNGGICDPNYCPEFQASACKLSGRLIFMVPGIEAGSLFELPTNSFYSLSQIRNKMLEVLAIHKKVSGTLGGAPMFYISKVQKEVSRLDPEKGAIKTKQWLTQLSVIVDLEALADRRPALAHEEAAVALEGHAEEEVPSDEPEIEEDETSTSDIPF